jgi:hypothetical protein
MSAQKPWTPPEGPTVEGEEEAARPNLSRCQASTLNAPQKKKKKKKKAQALALCPKNDLDPFVHLPFPSTRVERHSSRARRWKTCSIVQAATNAYAFPE